MENNNSIGKRFNFEIIDKLLMHLRELFNNKIIQLLIMLTPSYQMYTL